MKVNFMLFLSLSNVMSRCKGYEGFLNFLVALKKAGWVL
jgi:hypothetical protein